MTKKIITGFNRRIYRFWAVLLAILLTLGVFPTQPAKADAVIDAVSVGINPNCIAMNTITNKIYVTSADPGKMTVIDCTDYNVITTFDIGGYPQGVAVDETDNKIYVTDTSNYDVLVFDGETNTKTETLDMEGMPGGIAWDSVNNLFYVTIWETGKVAVIDGVTDTILEYIDVGNYPEAIDVNVETDKIYVTHDNNTVSVIDGSLKTVVSTLSVDLYPQDIAVNTTTNKIYVIHSLSNRVTVIDGITDSTTGIIEMGQDMITVAVNPSTNKIYVGDQVEGSVLVIDGTTDTLMQTIAIQDRFTPTAAVADKTRNKIYMTSLNTDDVKIIDGSGIDSVSVTGLTAPIQGELPGTVDSLIAGDDTYTVTGLTWQNYDGSPATIDGDGKFQNAGGLYRAFIELTAKPDNKFPPAFSYMPAVNTGFPSAGTVEGGDVLGNKLTFTVTFEEDITRIGVTGLIGPQTGEAPISLSALISNHPANYSVTGLTWLNYTETPATLDGSGRFTSGGQTYLARIELTSMPGYKFSSSNLFPSLGGGMKLRSETRNIGGGSVTGNKFYFSVYFPADINTVNVSGLVAPVAGATPVNGGLTSIVSVTYVDFYTTPPSITSYSFSRDVNTLTWQNDDGTPATLTDGKFNPYSNYKVVIKLWSDNTAGYLCKFPVGGLTPAVNVGTPSAGVTGGGYVAGNTLTFEVAFPATGAIPFKAITGITGVPTAATAGTPLTLSGTVAPANATNQTIVWSIQDAGTTGATVSGNTLSTTAEGTVAVRATITNGLTESSDYTQDFTITVSPAPVINATISPATGSFDKNPANQDDVQTTVTWGSATGVTGVRAGGNSIGADNYTVSGNTLTIKTEYLAARSTGSLVLMVEFNAGVSAVLTIAVTDTTPPSISPTSRNYDLSTPADVTTAITWNSATSVTDVVYSVTPAAAQYTLGVGDYTISGNALAIKNSFFSGLSLTAGAALEFDINFNTGATTTLSVDVVNSYTPSNDADLSSLSVNGTPVSGFDPNDIEYDVQQPYGTAIATVTATARDSNAQVIITQALSLPGSAAVTVTAENGTTARTYTINLTITTPAFVSVTSITSVPAAATAGTPLTLSGTVAPANATNKAIIWSIQNAGTTGATVSGNMLSAAASGTVTVRATITNGLTASTNYMQDFTITVSAVPVTTYTVTFNSNGSVYTTKTVNAGESVGSIAWPADPTRSSYTFGGWFTGENGSGTQFASATPVNAIMSVHAKWMYSGGGNGGGSPSDSGGTSSSSKTYNAEVNIGDSSNVTLPVTVDKSSGNASVDAGTGNSLMSYGNTTVITVPAIPDIDTYTLGISVSSLSTQDEQGALAFSTDTGTVTVPSNMLTGVLGISGNKAEISIGKGDKTSLPETVEAAIGDKPLISLGLSIDGRQIGWSNPNAPVTVSIPYTPTAAELANSESIVIWYIDSSGNAVSVPNGHYDPTTGTVIFTITHFSLYAVVYNKMSFSDVAPNAWYSKAVSFIAARGVTTGTGNENYSPEAKLTRGEFIVLMMRAYGIAPDANSTYNFADAGNTYYTGYLAAAKRLGISTGVGNNLFAPGKEIKRQEMFTLLYNALKLIGKLPQFDSGKSLSSFSDAGQIASWAKDAMILLVESGTVGGSAGKLTPLSTTTRAEMAQVLYNLLGK